MKKLDLTGRKFGRLLVVSEAGRIGKNKNLSWLCRCDCGCEKIILGCNLTGGKSQSCGCGQKEAASMASSTHGMSKTRLYGIYKGITQRCYNSNNPAYKYYGGKGIAICSEWRDNFLAFREWSLGNGYKEDSKIWECTIDRIDPKKDYEPGNCRWATMKKQQNNKLNSMFVAIGEEKLTIAEWADKIGTNKQTLYSKFYRILEQLGVENQDVAAFEIKLR